MYEQDLVISNATGLHARPASELVRFCNRFQSEVILHTDSGDEVNAKSIISILSNGIDRGTKVRLQVTGDDEKSAGPKIADFIFNLID